jgi:hypothetical protein
MEFQMAFSIETLRFKKRITLITLVGILLVAFTLPQPAAADGDQSILPSLPSFIATVRDGNPDALRGIYVASVMATPVMQQPVGNPWFISSEPNPVTQFSVASEVGNIGLLAHNYLAGEYFQNITENDTIVLIYGDGRTHSFKVTSIQHYQAGDPLNPWSTFKDLNSGEALTAEQLFNKVYRGEFHVTLQTCIEQDGNESWGRLFIIAVPIDVLSDFTKKTDIQ